MNRVSKLSNQMLIIDDIEFNRTNKENDDVAFVPFGYIENLQDSQEMLKHLKFILQKDLMRQDIFLIGSPGSLKRNLALAYCEIAKREVEIISITQDTTIADIKSRREIINSSVVWVDGPAVRAAIYGRVLIIDGVEKAERNVLSVLNNLLENKEMQLSDGRFLTNPERFEALRKGTTNTSNEINKGDIKLVKVSENFRVIALGVPSPYYAGNALDPPFRSRFQARDVTPIFDSENFYIQRINQARILFDNVEKLGIEGIPSRWLRRSEFPREYVNLIENIVTKFPNLSLRYIVGLIYPHTSFSWMDSLQRAIIFEIYDRCGILELNGSTTINKELGKYLNKNKDDDFDPFNRKQPNSNDIDIHKPPSLSKNSEASIIRESILGTKYSSNCLYGIKSIKKIKNQNFSLTFNHKKFKNKSVTIENVKGGNLLPTSLNKFIKIDYHLEILNQMLLLHACDVDLTIVGNRGCGKSLLVNQFAKLLGYDVRYFPLYYDLTSQDLLMKRSTKSNGDTIWVNSPLLEGCLSGDLVILDGLEQVPSATLASLQTLIKDRLITLPDGSRLISNIKFLKLQEKLNLNEKQINQKYKIFKIHESFRIISIARPNKSQALNNGMLISANGPTKTWLTPEMNVSFQPFIYIRSLVKEEEKQIITKTLNINNNIPKEIDQLIDLTHLLRERSDDEARSIAASLSTRQLLRISKRIISNLDFNLRTLIKNASLIKFLPSLTQEVLEDIMDKLNIVKEKTDASAINKLNSLKTVSKITNVNYNKTNLNTLRKQREIIGKLIIGDVEANIHVPINELLIPETLFYDNPRQSLTMQNMLIDFEYLNEHLLLIGNQGVGKNKLTDRFLHLLKLPREYIQLDRDTTVNHLTSQPIVVDGVIKYEDSPLVKAASMGHILVIDEADKAPTNVTSILKSLLADGEMLLSDGRRLVTDLSNRTNYDASKYIVIHPDFRAILLANRPGGLFMGNNFFKEIGDIFSSFVVDNPDEESELQLLKKYAPNVPLETLRKLTVAFGELRHLVNEGTIAYPYSTRELVNIVKHMELYPIDGMATILQNVFDFDTYSIEEKEIITNVFQKHGIPISLDTKYKVQTGNLTPLTNAVLTETWKRPQSLRQNPIHSLPYRVIDIPWKLNSLNETYFFDLNPTIQTSVKLNRFEGRSTTFDELLYSFRLPTTDSVSYGPSVGIIAMTSLMDGSIVLASNDSYNTLRLYRIHYPSMRFFDVHDVYIPHFNFRGKVVQNVSRPAPSRCKMCSLSDNRIVCYIHDEQMIYLIDLENNTEKLIEIPFDYFKKAKLTSSGDKKNSSGGGGVW